MTDKRIKMDCPFCHTSAKEIQIIIYPHYKIIRCPNCGCSFFGDYNKQELINKWNRR